MLQKFRLLNKGRLFFYYSYLHLNTAKLSLLHTNQNGKQFQVKPCLVITNFQSPGLIWVVNNCKKGVYSGNLQLLLTCRNGPTEGNGALPVSSGRDAELCLCGALTAGTPTLGSHLIVFMDAIRVNIMLNYTAIPLLMSSVSWFMVSRHGARTELCSGQGSSIQVPVSVQRHSAEQTGQC